MILNIPNYAKTILGNTNIHVILSYHYNFKSYIHNN